VREGLVALIVDAMREDGNAKYAGYRDEQDLREGLLQHIGAGRASAYRALTAKEKSEAEKIVRATIRKCRAKLPLPAKTYIFIFPWLPSRKDAAFHGSFGFAAYSGVVHLFLAPGRYTRESLADSVVHEINHSVSFYHHFDRYGRWTLLDHIINEGMAENFREDVLRTKPAPWAIALPEKKALAVLREIRPLLDSKSRSTYRRIFFGDTRYKRWTGYAIGYWLVREFRNRNKKLTWEQIVKTNPSEFLKHNA